ncbi:cytochrome c oxidase cbb3-type subunit 3 [Solimonas aquatica]|uniref:Cbb3-type cytochrome c oxidase subunit n=1 Tax=Solimonas aquatica TaxID=489703 RepID=A0A1H8ZML3_9GAMM|nr:cytochrome-c oxidase, cbb3-type subunit III [Solimonas aquatica]SEP65537.1 cytochrome c oxidase cbb3-type subunit 3 [Solimonas aquatica]
MNIMSNGFSIYIIVIVLGSLAACMWLLFGQSKGTKGESTGHVWDDDLREYNNPLPRWWLNLFVLTTVFALGYLAFYPGLGNFAGRLGWTAHGEMQQNLDKIVQARQETFATFKSKSVDELVQVPAALALGKSVFLNNCAGCHGPDGAGARGFPNLTDHDWLYGGDGATLVTTITNGRGGTMPPFGSTLSAEQIETLVAFVPHWSDPALPAAKREAGLAQFQQTCAACHGPEGKGNPMLGAPNLTDDTWLYGGDAKTVRETITNGRHGQMPAHETVLTADEIRVVAAYVESLSNPTGVAAAATPPAQP